MFGGPSACAETLTEAAEAPIEGAAVEPAAIDGPLAEPLSAEREATEPAVDAVQEDLADAAADAGTDGFGGLNRFAGIKG